MAPHAPTSPAARHTLMTALAALLLVGAVILAVDLQGSGSSPGTTFSEVLPGRDDRRTTAEDDGVVPDGATVFDDEYPGVSRMDPDLLDALREATTHAEADGVRLVVNSGWRSPDYQERLLHEAIDEHGSAEEAARWVSTPETSPHVAGDAVDIGPPAAAAWLVEHGAEHGLCQIYGNEPWHFELRPEAVDHGCPSRYPDPTHDPRMW